MARLPALPSIDVIRGFKGILDFYLWKGLPCVRAWPRWRPALQSDASKAAATLFGEIIKGYNTVGEIALTAYRELADGTPRTARDIYVAGIYGHLHQRTAPAPPPPPEEEMYDAYVCLRDKKPQNTHGGTFGSGAWRTRVLNDEHADPENICALAANQFVLAAGTYRCQISCPAEAVDVHQARLYNVTGAVMILPGTSEHTWTNSYVTTRSHILGRFTIAADQTLEVQHQCGTTEGTTGFGWRANFTDEIFTVAEFWREIEPD